MVGPQVRTCTPVPGRSSSRLPKKFPDTQLLAGLQSGILPFRFIRYPSGPQSSTHLPVSSRCLVCLQSSDPPPSAPRQVSLDCPPSRVKGPASTHQHTTTVEVKPYSHPHQRPALHASSSHAQTPQPITQGICPIHQVPTTVVAGLTVSWARG